MAGQDNCCADGRLFDRPRRRKLRRSLARAHHVRHETKHGLRSQHCGSPIWTARLATGQFKDLRTKLKCWFSAFGAAEGTRTPTVLPPHGPEPCASTNSATAAQGAQFYRNQGFCQRKSAPHVLQLRVLRALQTSVPRAIQTRIPRLCKVRVLRAPSMNQPQTPRVPAQMRVRAVRAIRTMCAKPSATTILCRAAN